MRTKAEANFLTVCILFKIPENKICVCRVVIVMIPRKLAPMLSGRRNKFEPRPSPRYGPSQSVNLVECAEQ